MAPTLVPYFPTLFGATAKSMGYHPFVNATAIPSAEYTNPDGVTRPPCAFCGFCERTPCMIGAKAQPTSVFLPVVQKRKSVTLRTGITVRRIVHEKGTNGGRARGVTYFDESGEEIFQPADLVILATYTLGNNHLLFLSGIGTPYNPSTGKGTLGKNLTHAGILILNAVFAWIAVTYLYGPPHLAVTVATLTGLLFAAPLNFTAGNLLSIYSPKKRDFATFGRQNVSQTTVLASFGTQIAIVGLGVGVFALARLYKNLWIAVLLFLLLSAVSIPVYIVMLHRLDGIALQRRETLLAELCRA